MDRTPRRSRLSGRTAGCAAAVVAVLLLGACQSSGEVRTAAVGATATSDGPDAASSGGSSLTPSGAPAPVGPSSNASSGGSASVGVTASGAAVPGSVPGAPAELPYPVGTVLSVVGIAHGDVLNLRAAPGLDQPVLTGLGPLATGLVSTGRGWLVEGGPLWAQVTASGTTGWASLAYLSVRGPTDDVTARVVELVGRRPSAPTMAELGRLVATALAGTEPPSRVAMSGAPTTADLGEVGYDVVGLADDSVNALRLTVFGQPTGSGAFSLKSVEATSFCARGTPAGGELCP